MSSSHQGNCRDCYQKIEEIVSSKMAEIKQKQRLAMRQYLRTLNPKEEVHKYTEARRPNLEAIK